MWRGNVAALGSSGLEQDLCQWDLAGCGSSSRQIWLSLTWPWFATLGAEAATTVTSV